MSKHNLYYRRMRVQLHVEIILLLYCYLYRTCFIWKLYIPTRFHFSLVSANGGKKDNWESWQEKTWKTQIVKKIHQEKLRFKTSKFFRTEKLRDQTASGIMTSINEANAKPEVTHQEFKRPHIDIEIWLYVQIKYRAYENWMWVWMFSFFNSIHSIQLRFISDKWFKLHCIEII